MMSLPALIGVSLSLLLLAAVVIVMGWRGKRINRRSMCRGCGYTLDGLQAPAACPECGADLSSPRSIRVGDRRHVRLFLVLGSLLLAGALALSGYTGSRMAREVKWIRFAPVWMLRNDVQVTNRADEDAALAEMLRRARADRLSEATLQEWIDLALLRQSDVNTVWNPLWGDLVQYAWSRDWVSDAKMDAYLRGALVEGWKMDHRPRVREGSRIAVRVRMPPRMRVGSDMTLPQFDLSMRYENVRIGEHEEPAMNLTLPNSDQPLSGEWSRMMPQIPRILSFPARVSANLSPGQYPINATMVAGIRLSDSRGIGGFHNSRSAWPGDHRFEWRQEVTSHIEIVPDADALIEVVDDPDALLLLQSHATASLRLFGAGSDSQFVICGVSLPKVAAPSVRRAALVIGEQRWPLGEVPTWVQSEMHFHTALPDLPADATHASIVLTPDARLAEETLDIGDSILGGEVVIADVPITREQRRQAESAARRGVPPLLTDP